MGRVAKSSLLIVGVILTAYSSCLFWSGRDPWLTVYVPGDELIQEHYLLTVCNETIEVSKPVVFVHDECEGTVFLERKEDGVRSDAYYVTVGMKMFFAFTILSGEIKAVEVIL